jgi:hypothetical protein
LAALDDALISSDPRHELTNAINHLQDTVSLSQQAYRKASFSRWEKLRGLSVNDSFHPRYKVGKRICSALAIITTIYASIGERKLALKYAEELRNEAGKAYPSNFGVSRQSDWVPRWVRDSRAKNAPPAEFVRQRSSLDPNRDLGYWFITGHYGRGTDNLEEAFSFFESLDLLLAQVGARPYNLQLQVHVSETNQFPVNVREGDKLPPMRHWEFRTSSRRDFLAQFQKAIQAG